MTTKSEWQAVNDQIMADDRRRLGEPPTAEKLLAYERGDLTPEEEAHIREHLVCNPELAAMIAEPFPTEGAEPGDPDFMPDDELERHWAAMQKKMRPHDGDGGGAVYVWRTATALAAAVAVVLGALLWQTTEKLSEPRAVWEEQVLYPDGRRGPEPGPATLTAQGESILLVTPLIGPRDFREYRLEIVNVSSKRTVWRSSALTPRDDDALAILVNRRFLDAGIYQIVVYGRGAEEERLATYSLRVPSR
jgi:hypothetical protein